MIPLGDLPGGQYYSKAFDVNNRAEVVGSSVSAARGLEAFIWDQQNGMRSLGTAADGSFAGVAYAINDLGQVTGGALVPPLWREQAYFWDPIDGFTIVGFGPPPRWAEGLGINDLGQIVGVGGNDDLEGDGFIWDRQNGIRRLTDLVDAASFRRYGRIGDAVSINNRGQIGAQIDGEAAILTPFVLADMNCDGSLNTFDIQPFVLTLQWLSGDDAAREEYENTYPGCHGDWAADANQDGSVNQFDIQPLIDLLSG